MRYPKLQIVECVFGDFHFTTFIRQSFCRECVSLTGPSMCVDAGVVNDQCAGDGPSIVTVDNPDSLHPWLCLRFRFGTIRIVCSAFIEIFRRVFGLAVVDLLRRSFAGCSDERQREHNDSANGEGRGDSASDLWIHVAG